MNVIYSRFFKRQIKTLSRRYRHIKSDLTPLLNGLLSGETVGDQLTGIGHTLYKVRLKNSDNHKGKSGGYRVIYYLKTDVDCILLNIYSKSDQEDIAPDRLQELISEANQELDELTS